jgi:hypothetical protein
VDIVFPAFYCQCIVQTNQPHLRSTTTKTNRDLYQKLHETAITKTHFFISQQFSYCMAYTMLKESTLVNDELERIQKYITLAFALRN